MTDQSAARRMRLLECIQLSSPGIDLSSLAISQGVDERTIRRDVDYLQELVNDIGHVSLQRGKVIASRTGVSAGYFTEQTEANQAAKEAISLVVAEMIHDNMAVALTAGSTTFQVARALRHRHVDGTKLRNPIVFTNSLPALMEFIDCGISTGILGEVFNQDDCAFHSHEFHSTFQASIAIVGASGAVANSFTGTLDLFSHRSEEAAFLKQLLLPIPEIVVAVDASKIGHRHPWAFTNAQILTGKTLRICTNALTENQMEEMEKLKVSAKKIGCEFSVHTCSDQNTL